VGNCWKWQGVKRLEVKAGTNFIFWNCERKVCLHCSADWIDYNKSFCYASGVFQWVKGLHNDIVLVVSLLVAIMKDLVALKSKWLTFLCLHGLIVAALSCTYSHTKVIQTLHHTSPWFIMPRCACAAKAYGSRLVFLSVCHSVCYRDSGSTRAIQVH